MHADMESSMGLPSIKHWDLAILYVNKRWCCIDVVERELEARKRSSDYLEESALEYEESRKEWDERTMDQVQASELPSARVIIVDWSSLVRKAFDERRRKEEKSDEEDFSGFGFPMGGYEAELRNMNLGPNEVVGLLIEKLEDLLSAGTMRAEVYASLKPEVVERMNQMYKEAFGSFIVKFEVLLRRRLIFVPLFNKVERMYYAAFEEFLDEDMFCAGLEEMLAAEVTRPMKAQAELLYAVVVSAISLLVFVYQYLIGHIDKGGTLTCSSGSFQFRATFISIVLFEGAYVWIKFRDVPYSGYIRYDKRSGKTTIEAKYKPTVKCLKSGRSGGYIYLGSCVDEQEANIKYRIAASCYGEGADPLEPGDGPYFQIPLMSREEIQSLSVLSDEEKKNRVKDIVSEVSEEYRQWRANHSSPDHDLYQEINPSHFGNNGSAVGFPPPLEDPPVVLEEPSLEIFPAHELPDASLQQPFEDIQAQRPAIGMLTSGDHRAMRPEPAATDCLMDDVLDALPDLTNDVVSPISNEVDTGVVDGNTQHDSEASRSANVSLVLIPQQRSDAEAILMDMIRELQQTIKEKDQKIQEAEQEKQLMIKEMGQKLQKAEQEKQLMIKEKQEAEKDIHAMKLMIEAKDRKIAELELANLRREL